MEIVEHTFKNNTVEKLGTINGVFANVRDCIRRKVKNKKSSFTLKLFNLPEINKNNICMIIDLARYCNVGKLLLPFSWFCYEIYEAKIKRYGNFVLEFYYVGEK